MFIGREEEEHSGITTDIKKILTWLQFPLSRGGRQDTAQIALICWAESRVALKLACLEWVPGIGRRFLWNSVHVQK